MGKEISLEEGKYDSGVDGWLNENVIETDEAFFSFVIVKLVSWCLINKICWKSVDEDHNNDC